MTSEGRVRPIEILLIEDNPADVRLTVEGLKEAKVANKLHAIMDGRKALDFLFHRGEYVDAPRPDVVLLDLNCRAWTDARSSSRSRAIRSCA